MFVLTTVGCNRNIDLAETVRLGLALGAGVVKDPCNDIWLFVTVCKVVLIAYPL